MMGGNTGGPNTYLGPQSVVTEAKHFAAYGYRCVPSIQRMLGMRPPPHYTLSWMCLAGVRCTSHATRCC
jgi:hypothetical protein